MVLEVPKRFRNTVALVISNTDKCISKQALIHVSKILWKSRKENPQKLTQLSSRSHPRHLVGKRTAQKDTTIDITSDSQVNSNFPYRWSPVSLTFNNYFYLFLYSYNVNNHKQQRATSKITKEPKQKSRLGTASNKNYWEGGWAGGLELVCGRPTLALSSALVHQTLSCLVCVEDT